MRLSSLALAVLAVLACGLVLTAWAVEQGMVRLRASVENFRASPNGRKLGTLLEGTEIERISQDGKWVRFRVEGWVWGPSLEGFQLERDEPDEREPEPRTPLRDAVPDLKKFIKEQGGTFYSVQLDPDLKRVTLRFRVGGALEPEALIRKQMRTQREVVEVLDGKVEFTSVRVECNRPDGGGRVGLEIAETPAAEMERMSADSVGSWRAVTRISHDGGQTWEDGN
ncbi:MAG: hypothetical protein R6U10_05020 [Thermoplasmatota archaeon]